MKRAWMLWLTLALGACSAGEATTDAGASVDAAPSVDGAATDAAAVDAAIEPDAEPWPVLPACELMPSGGGEHELFEGRSTDGRVSYRLWRCFVMQGAGFTGIYRADAFELVVDGVTRRVTTEAIEYDSTHHNWNDSLVATDAAGALHWRVEFQRAASCGTSCARRTAPARRCCPRPAWTTDRSVQPTWLQYSGLEYSAPQSVSLTDHAASAPAWGSHARSFPGLRISSPGVVRIGAST